MEDFVEITGINEFEVLNVLEDEDGRSVMFEVKRKNLPQSCPKCGCVGPFYKHSPGERIVQDVNHGNKLQYLKIHTYRYKCRDCGATFQEPYDSISGRDRITYRLRMIIMDRVLNHTFTDVANDYSISVNTVRRIFAEYVELHKQDLIYKAPRVLGMDEAHLNGKYRCVFSDTENFRLLDLHPNRDSPELIALIRAMDGFQNIKVVTMDMYAPYRKLIKDTLV